MKLRTLVVDLTCPYGNHYNLMLCEICVAQQNDMKNDLNDPHVFHAHKFWVNTTQTTTDTIWTATWGTTPTTATANTFTWTTSTTA